MPQFLANKRSRSLFELLGKRGRILQAQFYWIPLEWCYAAVSSFLANPPGLGEDYSEDCGKYSSFFPLEGACRCFIVTRRSLSKSFDCVAEIPVLPVANKLHRSSVETIAAYMLLAPTYDLHVVQFYESVVRRKTQACHECQPMSL